MSKLHTYTYQVNPKGLITPSGKAISITIPRKDKAPFNFGIPIAAMHVSPGKPSYTTYTEMVNGVQRQMVRFKMAAWAHKKYTIGKLKAWKAKQQGNQPQYQQQQQRY